jgi:tripartite-type tricarboxylate transporter receptor subunit TctC
MDRRHFIAGATAASALAAAPARAAVNFERKTIVMICPFGVGGGGDLWSRFIAPYLSQYLPGKPNVVVENHPGGGSISGTNGFVINAKPDGLMILSTSASTQFPYLLGQKQVKYDYRNLRFFLAGPTGGVAFVAAKYGLKSVKDLAKLKGVQMNYASQGATSLDLAPMLAFRLLGLDVKHIFGFPGRGEGLLAFERGEMNIDYQTSTAYKRNVLPLIAKGEATPLFSFGALDDKGDLGRDPNFPDLPHVAEAYEIVFGKPPSGVEWDAFKAFLLSGFPAQKLMMLQKGTPDDILEAYRQAIRDMRNDPDYKAKRDDIIGEYEQVTDAAGEALYQRATTISPEARAWVRDYLTKNYQVDLN